MTTKDETAERRDHARAFLLSILQPGIRIKGIVWHHTERQSSVTFACAIVRHGGSPEIYVLDSWIAKTLDRQIDDRRGGVMLGCETPFDVIQELGCALWPNGTPEPHSVRNSQPDSSGSYALTYDRL